MAFIMLLRVSHGFKGTQVMCAINDPLGQTYCPSSNDHYSHLKIVLFYEILNLKVGRTDTCGYSYYYRP